MPRGPLRGRRADGRADRPALGFQRGRAAVVGKLVRWHLLLPTIATRRDIEDPSTAANVAEIVETEDFLDLLAALTASDAQATSPAAWSPWRKGLTEGLVEKVRGVLDETVTTPTAEDYEGWPVWGAVAGARRDAAGRLPAHGRVPSRRLAAQGS